MKETPPWTRAASAPDPRIKAIVTLDGSNQVLHFAELTRVQVPALGIGEEWNAVMDWQARQHAAFRAIRRTGWMSGTPYISHSATSAKPLT